MSEKTERVLVDVTIAAPIDQVWRSVRDPESIAKWFGWDADSLKEEIDFIFTKHAVADDAAKTLQFGEWEGSSHRFELEAQGQVTRFRVVQSGPVGDDDWESVYSEVTEGWISFIQQLKFLFERHAGEARRTLRLSGTASEGHQAPSVALGLGGIRDRALGSRYSMDLASGERVEGKVWHTARHQLGLTVDGWNDALLIVVDKPPSGGAPGGGAITITTFGLPAEDFAALEARLRGWWSATYPAD